MAFDPENKIVKLCADGMAAEGRGQMELAMTLFRQAWDESSDDFDRFTSAHYIARHQKTVADKLKWDQTSLQLALKIDDDSVKSYYPSLYLNIGKCYEDLKDAGMAKVNYQKGLAFSALLPDDGYGKMIRSGLENGIARVSNHN